MSNHPETGAADSDKSGSPENGPISLAAKSVALETQNDSGQLDIVTQRFAVAITEPMRDLIDPVDPADPIALQFLPDTRELQEHPDELHDPIGDSPHSPMPGIVHRYPDRLLLMPIRVCPVYCRFCFRRETVGKKNDALLDDQQLADALDYIRAHTEVWEVILSGGDPLLLSPRRLKNILAQLNMIEHVKVVRIHTRVPVVDPTRISSDLLVALKEVSSLFVVLHTNHPRELTGDALAACARLVDNGIPMLSQSVLLKDINDNVKTLEQLLRTLVENRIKPYYLHHADKARGTGHFRTSINAGQTLMRELRGTASGLCQPEYVLDIPGGHGKVPVGPRWLETCGPNHHAVRDHHGIAHDYSD